MKGNGNMLGNFNPSAIVNEIYDMMDDYETHGCDLYDFGLTDAIADYLANCLHIEYNLACSDWPNEEGGVCGVAFVDDGHPQLIMFDYKY